MKKLILLYIVISFISYKSSYGQDTISIEYDQSKKRIITNTKRIKLKKGTAYKFKIEGVNTAYMNCSFDAKFFFLSSSTPEIIKPLFLGISNTADLSQKAFFSTEKSIKNDSTMSEKEKLSRFKDVFDSSYEDLAYLVKKADYLYKENVKKVDSSSAKKMKTEILSNFALDNIEELKTKILIDISVTKLVYDIYRNDFKNIHHTDTSMAYFLEDLSSMEYRINRLNEKDFDEIINLIERATIAKQTVVSKGFTANKDLMELNILLVDQYKKDTIYQDISLFYPIKNLSFDFSTGFFYNNLVESSYSLKSRDTINNNILENNTSNFDISFGALGHVSYELTNYFKAGVSMGAALSPLDGKTRYMLGFSALLFREKQLGLNGGWIFANMKELAVSVEEDETGKYVPISITEVPTYNKVKSGFYLGLTYNLASKKKEK